MTILEFDKTCPQCDSNDVELISYSDDVEHKGFVLSVQGLQEHSCKACDHDWKTQSDFEHNFEVLKAAYVVVRDKKRAQEGLLTGIEIEEIRNFFHLTQREAAVLFGGGYNAFNKYESGEVLQSFAMDRLLRMTKAFGEHAIEFLKKPHVEHYFKVTKTVKAHFPDYLIAHSLLAHPGYAIEETFAKAFHLDVTNAVPAYVINHQRANAR